MAANDQGVKPPSIKTKLVEGLIGGVPVGLAGGILVACFSHPLVARKVPWGSGGAIAGGLLGGLALGSIGGLLGGTVGGALVTAGGWLIVGFGFLAEAGPGS